MDEFSQVC